MSSQGIDTSDLYDWEIKKIGEIWKALMSKWSSKPNSKANLTELSKEANDLFIKAGFVVNVMWENSLIIDPRTQQPRPIEIEVMGRIPAEAGKEFEHDRKRWEVLNANERGEKFHGQKG